MKPLIFRTFGRIDVVFAVVRRVVHSCSAIFVGDFVIVVSFGESGFLAPLFAVRGNKYHQQSVFLIGQYRFSMVYYNASQCGHTSFAYHGKGATWGTLARTVQIDRQKIGERGSDNA